MRRLRKKWHQKWHHQPSHRCSHRCSQENKKHHSCIPRCRHQMYNHHHHHTSPSQPPHHSRKKNKSLPPHVREESQVFKKPEMCSKSLPVKLCRTWLRPWLLNHNTSMLHDGRLLCEESPQLLQSEKWSSKTGKPTTRIPIRLAVNWVNPLKICHHPNLGNLKHLS
jgi:hypothetical protein